MLSVKSGVSRVVKIDVFSASPTPTGKCQSLHWSGVQIQLGNGEWGSGMGEWGNGEVGMGEWVWGMRESECGMGHGGMGNWGMGEWENGNREWGCGIGGWEICTCEAKI